jgi:hypothetical protein
MRKSTFALLALAALALAVPAGAANLVSEPFSYANGNLTPNGGWASFSGAGLDVQVASGRATGGAIGNPAIDDHIFFTAQPTTSKTYACFDCLIPNPGVGAPKPIYFAALNDAGTANFVSRVYVLNLVAGGWTFGLSHSSTSTTVGVVPWTSALSYDTNYRITINYDPVAHSSTMWINATAESDPSVSITNAAVAGLSTATFALRQSNAAATLPASPSYAGTLDWNFSVDNVGVGTTFNDACFQATPTQNTTWGRVKTIYR